MAWAAVRTLADNATLPTIRKKVALKRNHSSHIGCTRLRAWRLPARPIWPGIHSVHISEEKLPLNTFLIEAYNVGSIVRSSAILGLKLERRFQPLVSRFYTAF